MAITAIVDERVWKTELTANDATAQEPLGSIRREYDSTNGEKWFLYVRTSAAVAAYAPVVWSGVTGYTVNDSTATADLGKTRAVGVASNGAISSTYYGWIQVRGHCKHILTGPTAGQCTSAYAECIYASGGVQSFRKQTLQSGSTGIVLAGIVAYYKVDAASSTSGYIHTY